MGAWGSGIVVITPGDEGAISTVGTYINPQPPISGINYTSTGERWDAIAYKMYGDATQVQGLILNNPGIAALDYVPQGAQVFVPLLTVAADTSTSTPWG